MRSACLALLLAGCPSSGGDDAFPVVPGGGDDTAINPMIDAPAPDASGDAMTAISGRVCVINDLRNLTSCATGNASGITVSLGTSTATTAVDGSFTIAAPAGSNLIWTVSALGFVPTVMPFGAVPLLPVVTVDRYSTLLLDNGVVLQAGEGSVFVRAVRSGVPVSGVTAAIDPPSQYGPLYDGTSAALWDRDSTGSGGVIWFPDALVGTAALTVLAPTSPTPLTVSVPVAEGAITFATVGIP